MEIWGYGAMLLPSGIGSQPLIEKKITASSRLGGRQMVSASTALLMSSINVLRRDGRKRKRMAPPLGPAALSSGSGKSQRTGSTRLPAICIQEYTQIRTYDGNCFPQLHRAGFFFTFTVEFVSHFEVEVQLVYRFWEIKAKQAKQIKQQIYM